MPFARPSAQDTLSRVQSYFDVYLPGSDSRLRRTVENVIAKVLVMILQLLYGYLDWIAKQILPDTADDEFLDLHGNDVNLPRKAASLATGPVTITGTTGDVAAAGSILQRNDSVQYSLVADVAMVNGTGTGTVIALVAGSAGNCDSGTKLTFTSPDDGIQAAAVVGTAGLTAGEDIEGPDDYRARILARRRQPPQGGANFDYIEWAEKVAGVTRVWVYRNQYGAGTVAVLFVMDGNAITNIPSADEVAAVQTYIDTVRPVTADVTVLAPTPLVANFDIHLNPNTAAVQIAILAELQDFFAREAAPGTTLYLSRIDEAISSAAGEFDHVVVSPSANIVPAFGQIPQLGAISWEST